ncbi:unnamed protein product, partial [Urochloa humidicola]
EVTLGLSKPFMQAMSEHIPVWSEDAFKWKFTRAPLKYKIDKNSSGYFILQCMDAWCSKKETTIYTVSI